MEDDEQDEFDELVGVNKSIILVIKEVPRLKPARLRYGDKPRMRKAEIAAVQAARRAFQRELER
jgi:hypothetical protein